MKRANLGMIRRRYVILLTLFCFRLVRKLVEQTMMEHENTKEARRKLQEYKQKLGKTRAFSSAKFQPRFLLEHSDDVKDRICLFFRFYYFF